MEAIGIDLGTTGICGVVIDTESGEILKSRTVNSEAFIETENEWEKIQDTEKIIGVSCEILDSLISENTVSIGVTGQMHGIVYIDEEGKAVSPLYTWQDGRGDLEYKDGKTYAEYLGSNTGYGLVTDFYNRENGLVANKAVSFCTIHDYLVMTLCGNNKPLVHISDAASFGLFDLKNKKFNIQVPFEFTEETLICGKYRNIPVGVAIGDNQASVFATTLENDILLNYGTGSQVSVISDSIVEAPGTEARPYFDGKFLLVGAALCGGRAFALLKDFYKCILEKVANVSDGQVYAIMDKMLSEFQGTKLKADTRFSGTRADKSIKGVISGISTENFTPEDLTLAVVEGMVEELYEMYLGMGVEREGVAGSGNALRKNPTLIKIAEEKFGKKIKIPKFSEEAAFGAALFGSIAAKVFKNTKEAQKLIKYN